MTHPSTLDRIQRIARQGNVSAERVNTLLHALDADTKHYALPLDVAESRVFSPSYKAAFASKYSWMFACALILPATCTGWIAQKLGLQDGLLISAWLLGAGLTRLAYAQALEFRFRESFRLRERFQHRLEPENLAIETLVVAPKTMAGNAESGKDRSRLSGHFVGFAPHAEPQIYAGFFHLDIGFLFFDSEKLVFLGDKDRFVLRKDQIVGMIPAPSAPGLRGSSGVVISWLDSTTETKRTFTVRLSGIPDYRTALATGKMWVSNVLDWYQQGTHLPDLPLSVPEKTPEPVTEPGNSPRVYGSIRALISRLVWIGGLTLLMCLLLNLSFSPDTGGAAFYALVIAMGMAVFQWLPYAGYREAPENP